MHTYSIITQVYGNILWEQAQQPHASSLEAGTLLYPYSYKA